MSLNIKSKEKLNKEKQKLHIKHHTYNNKGITLIALIITIVILLILAVVTINAVQGDGIIGYAKRAKETYQEEQDKENIKLALSEYKMENYADNIKKSLDQYLEEKDWCSSAKQNDDESIDVTTKEGRMYKIDKDGNIEELTGIGLNKEQILLELADEASTTTLTATLNGIEGEIKWSIEEDVKTVSTGTNESSIVTINITSGNTITVTAKALGEATITATCGKNSATCKVIVTAPIEVSEAPFVEYNVSYTDMRNNQQYTKDNGWRLQSATPNGDGTYSNVKLMSTGIPAMLYYYYYDNRTDCDWSVKEEDKLTEFKKILGENDFAFYNGSGTYYGLRGAAGFYYNFGQIKFKYGTDKEEANKGYFTSITSNNTTYNNSGDNTEKTGDEIFNLYKGKGATVRLLTLPELNKALNREDIDSINIITDQTGLYRLDQLKSISDMSQYSYSSGSYWLASPYPGGGNYDLYVCNVNYNGSFSYNISSNISNFGVRPLVCLNSNIQLIDSNKDGVLEIKGIE